MIDSHVGIDIAKAKFDVGIFVSHSKNIPHHSFPNSDEGFQDFIRWLKVERLALHPHFCMEATGRYGENLARFLHDAGFLVSVVNPSCIKNYARSKLRRTKTDKVDAAIIAEYCFKESPTSWTPLSKEARELQQMSRELDYIKSLLADEKSRVKSGSHAAAVSDSMKSRVHFFEFQIQELENEINSVIENSEKLKKEKNLLLSVPGIGITTANAIIAEIPDISKFKSAKQLVAFAGLVPREQSSGTLIGKTRMSKVGSSRLRKILYMPAVSAKRYNPVIIALSARIEKSGKSKMVAIGAAMRKLVHIIFGILKSGKVFDMHLHALGT